MLKIDLFIHIKGNYSEILCYIYRNDCLICYLNKLLKAIDCGIRLLKNSIELKGLDVWLWAFIIVLKQLRINNYKEKF